MNYETRIAECVSELVAAAREIAKDDADFRTTDFAGFERVMYQDEDTRHRHDLTREDFSDALSEAFAQFHAVAQ